MYSEKDLNCVLYLLVRWIFFLSFLWSCRKTRFWEVARRRKWKKEMYCHLKPTMNATFLRSHKERMNAARGNVCR